MDLKTTSSELKRVLNFLKPIINAVPLLDEMIDLERRHNDLEDTIKSLTEKKETIGKSIEEHQQQLQNKKNEVRTEIVKIENDIQAQKEFLLKEYDKKIVVKEEELKLMLKKIEETKSNVNEMRSEETGLRKKLHELKKLFVNTETEIEKVGE